MLAIRAAHAFDGKQFLSGGATVLVDGDRIAGVLTGGVGLPAGVEAIDYDGTVLPGLFDCHTHLVADSTVGGLERAGTMSDDRVDAVIGDSLRAHAAAGVTTVRDLGDRGYRTLGFRGRAGLPRVVAAGPATLHALMPAPPPPLAALMARFNVTSFDEFYAERIGLHTRLREHSVTVVTGVDSGMAPPKQHGNAWRAVAEMVEAGYPPADALATATSIAAQACRLAGETGRLAQGYAADMLVVDGDVSTDIAALGSPHLVIIRGTSIRLEARPADPDSDRP